MTNSPSSIHMHTDLLPPSPVLCKTATLGESGEQSSAGGHSSSLTAGNESKQSRLNILFKKPRYVLIRKFATACVRQGVCVYTDREVRKGKPVRSNHS